MMRILVDTHILLWVQGQPRRLPPGARALLEDPSNTFLFSVASIWEIAIKTQMRKPGFSVRAGLVATTARSDGFVELPITSDAAALVADLPLHHKDPFDRLLIAQAMSLPARLLTVDARLKPYSELVTVV